MTIDFNMNEEKERTAFLFILFIGIGLRLWQIGWGLPEIFEEAFPFHIAAKFWNWNGTGYDFNPHFFNYPALTFYLTFAVQAVQFGIGHLLGIYPTLVSFGNDVSSSIVVIRLLSIAFDVGTMVAAYKLTRTMFGSGTALLCAGLIAVNSLHIKQAHLINVDTALTFFAMLSVLYIWKMFHDPTRKNYLIAGMCIGLAAASKYTGAYLLAALVIAHLMQQRSVADMIRSLAHPALYLAIGISLVVFFIFNPYILLSPQEFWKDFSYEQYHMSTGHLGLNSSQSTFSFYFLDILPSVLGWILFLSVIIRGISYFFERNKPGIILMLFPAVTLAIIGMWEMRADRYVLPLLPMMIIIGADGIVQGWNRLRSYLQQIHLESFFRFVLPPVVLILIFFPSIQSDVSYYKSFSNPDTRILAKDWISKNLPEGSSYATGPFGIQFPRGTYLPVEIPFSPTGSENLTPFYDPRWYEDIDLLIASDYDYGRFAQDPKKFHSILNFYDTLRSRWSLAHEINVGQNQQGYTFWFYKPPSQTPEAFNSELFQNLSILAETTLVVTFSENLAFALFYKNRFIKSEQLMRFAVSLEPDNTRLLKELTWTIYKRNHFEEALPFVIHSLAIDGSQSEMVALEGSIFLKLNKLDEADSTLHRAIAMNNRLELPYLDLETLYTQRSDHQQLVTILRQHKSIVGTNGETAKHIDEQLRALHENP